MNGQTVSQAYLLGIRDERELLERERAEYERDPLGFSREMLASVNLTRGQGFSGDMAEFMRGSRDFWRNQVSKSLQRGASK